MSVFSWWNQTSLSRHFASEEEASDTHKKSISLLRGTNSTPIPLKKFPSQSCSSMWASVLKRLQDCDPNYARTVKSRRVGNSSQRQTSVVYVRRVERFMQQLTSMLQSTDIETLENAEPSECLLEQLRLHRHKLNDTAFVLSHCPLLPLHPKIITCLRETPDQLPLSPEEELLFDKLLARLRAKLGVQQASKLRSSRSRARFRQALRSLKEKRKNENGHRTQKERDLGDLDLLEAIKFCVWSGKLSHWRLELLHVTGSKLPEQTLVDAAMVHLVQRRHFFAASDLRHYLRFKSYNRFLHTLGAAHLSEPEIHIAQSHSAETILAALNGKDKQRILTHFCNALKNTTHSDKDGVSETLQQLEAHVSGLGKRKCDHFVSLSSWHAEVYEEMRAHEKKVHRSAWPQARLERMSRLFVAFMFEMQNFAFCCKLDIATFLQVATVQQLTTAIQTACEAHQVRNERVKTSYHTHHAKVHVIKSLHFIKASLRKRIGCDVMSISISSVLSGIENRRISADSNVRRNYTQQEVDAMLAVTKDPVETLVITLLQEVALRASAIRHLQYFMLLDEQHKPRDLCTVPEKNQTKRSFVVSPNLQGKIKALSDFLRHYVYSNNSKEHIHKSYILNLTNPANPLAPGTLSAMLKRIARDAEIKDVTVHLHGFRHTLVDRLLSVGNSMDLVSKFMGHRHVQTTSFFYFVPTAREIQDRLINPFIQDTKNTNDTSADKHKEKDNNEDRNKENVVLLAKIQACRELIDAFMQQCDTQTQNEVLNLRPEFRQILDVDFTKTNTSNATDNHEHEQEHEREQDDLTTQSPDNSEHTEHTAHRTPSPSSPPSPPRHPLLHSLYLPTPTSTLTPTSATATQTTATHSAPSVFHSDFGYEGSTYD